MWCVGTEHEACVCGIALVNCPSRTGAMLLIASILAGWLWDAFGPTATFLAGAVFSGFAALIMAIRTKARQSPVTDDCVHVPPGVRMPRRSLSGGDIRIFATVGVYMHARAAMRAAR